MQDLESKAPQDSDTTITELMIPSYANFGGKIHGGILLSLMDKVAFVCATKHAGNYCVTVSVEEVDFLQPVEVGDLVSMMARVNYVGNTSLVVGIKVTAENPKKKHVKHTNTSYFTMVAKENDQLAIVPPLLLRSDKDVRRFADALFRKKLKRYFRDQMKEQKNEDLDKMIALLKNERCEIAIK
jgi:uncharacterized protein (TIGR00369 family)